MSWAAGRPERLVALAALLTHAAVLALLIWHHEMWRDEMQMWLLARDSGSLLELWQNSRYDGHPLLWHLTLYPLARFFTSPVAAQAAHWAIAVAAAAVVLWRAPFPLLVRVGIVFSYLPLYEYGTITRNYALTVLGVWIAAAALASARTPWPAVAGVLIAANASPMGIVLLPPLAAAVALTPAWRRWRSWALAVLAIGAALAAFQCLPPPDNERAGQWYFYFNVRVAARVVRGFLVAFFPIPRAVTEFWGSSPFFPLWPLSTRTAWTIVLLATPPLLAIVAFVTAKVAPSRRALATWLLAFLGLTALTYFKLPGTMRHFGFLWIAFVAVIWVAVADGAVSRRLGTWLLAPTLAAGVVGSAMAAVREVRSPFSGAQATAAVIRAERLAALPIVAGNDYAVSALPGYLPLGRVYYPAGQVEGSFIVYDMARKTRTARLTQRDIVAEALARDRGDGVVLVHKEPLARIYEPLCMLFHESLRTIVPDEHLYAYRCRRRD